MISRREHTGRTWETLRNKLYSLELAISKQEENILILAKNALKRSEQILGESPIVEPVKEIVSSSPPTSKDAIKPLELGKYCSKVKSIIIFFINFVQPQPRTG